MNNTLKDIFRNKNMKFVEIQCWVNLELVAYNRKEKEKNKIFLLESW